MNWIEVKEIVVNYAFKILFSLVLLLIANYIIKYIVNTIKNLLNKIEVLPTLATLLSDLIKFILWILIVAAILNILGLKEISLALGGSIAVLGFGLSKSIGSVTGDLIAGIFLIIDDDFQVGYRVKSSGVEGIVESLDIRKTKIRDVDGNLHVIPNNKVDGTILIIEDDSCYNNQKVLDK